MMVAMMAAGQQNPSCAHYSDFLLSPFLILVCLLYVHMYIYVHMCTAPQRRSEDIWYHVSQLSDSGAGIMTLLIDPNLIFCFPTLPN